MTEPIALERLTHYFGDRPALRDVSFSVPRGSVTAVVGRNGSGKTTTLRILLGLLRPTRGRASVYGCPSHDISLEVLGRIGYMAENHPIHPWMNARDARGLQKGTFPRWREPLFRTVLDVFRIDESTRSRNLSRGQRAGLCLALTLATDPELLILDDPALGLDPVARQSLLEALIFFTQGSGRTILLASHMLSDIERLADQVAVLDRGVLRALCSVDTFVEKIHRYVLRFSASAPELPVLPGLLCSRRTQGEWDLTLVDPRSEVQQALRDLNPIAMDRVPLNLEQALIAYLGDRGEQPSLAASLGRLA